jgi:hypothetical protein
MWRALRERFQKYRTLVRFGQGRRSLLVASTWTLRFLGVPTLEPL